MKRTTLLIALLTSISSTAFARSVDRAPDDHERVDNHREVGVAKLVVPIVVEGPKGKLGTGPDGTLGDMLGPRMKVGVDVGVPLSANWRVSGRSAFIWGGAGEAFETICDAGAEAADEEDSDSSGHPTCGSYGLTLEAHLRHDFRADVPVGSPSPWVSFGAGVEHAWLIGSSGKSDRVIGSFDGEFTGVNFAMPAVGIDWRADERHILGLFACASVGRYLNRKATAGVRLAPDIDADFGGSATHAWIGGGMQVGWF